jgi:tetratricopeptide (TPR) repeat protein
MVRFRAHVVGHRIALVKTSTTFALAILAALAPQVTLAQQDSKTAKAEAKAHFMSGQRHYNLNELPEALADFKDAYRIYPDPVFLFNLGQCERQLGHFEEAIRFYHNFLREQPKAPNRQEVLHKIDEMEAAIRTRPQEPSQPPPAPAPEAAAVPEPALPAGEVAAPTREALPPAPTADTLGPSAAAPASAPTTQAPAERPAELPANPQSAAPPAAPVALGQGQAARIDLAEEAPTPAPQSPPAFYQRWWFWTGVAVVAAGVGLGIYAASSGQSASPPNADLGTRRVF